MQLDGKNIILTGAASGIGRALLNLLADFPAQIIAVDKDSSGLRDLPNGKAKIIPHNCDLSQPDAINTLFEQAIQTFGSVDVFIANAGFAYYEKIETADWGRLEQIYRVNVFSPLYALEKMQILNRGRPHKVVITASAMSFIGLPGYALYSSTKAALHRFAEAYRYEMDDPASLMLVYPIGTRTSFFQSASQARPAPQPWPTQTPEQVARAILRGIQRDSRSVFPFGAFRFLLAVPFLGKLEQAIEAWRLNRWQRNIV